MYIDWTVFDGDPENTGTCECGRVFRSHFKGFWIEDNYRYLARRDCPDCGRNNAIKSTGPSYDTMRIG